MKKSPFFKGIVGLSLVVGVLAVGQSVTFAKPADTRPVLPITKKVSPLPLSLKPSSAPLLWVTPVLEQKKSVLPITLNAPFLPIHKGVELLPFNLTSPLLPIQK
jgi:hypothetical protein